MTRAQGDNLRALVGLVLIALATVGVFVLLAWLILADAGCVKQWGPLHEVAERVISSCSGRKSTAQRSS